MIHGWTLSVLTSWSGGGGKNRVNKNHHLRPPEQCTPRPRLGRRPALRSRAVERSEVEGFACPSILRWYHGAAGPVLVGRVVGVHPVHEAQEREAGTQQLQVAALKGLLVEGRKRVVPGWLDSTLQTHILESMLAGDGHQTEIAGDVLRVGRQRANLGRGGAKVSKAEGGETSGRP